MDTSDEKDTTAATLEALMARGEPGETESQGKVRKAPVVASDGMPSWSYNQVEDEIADRVHGFTSGMARVCTGGPCPPSVVYSSIHTD